MIIVFDIQQFLAKFIFNFYKFLDFFGPFASTLLIKGLLINNRAKLNGTQDVMHTKDVFVTKLFSRMLQFF